ncbi:GvpL/GvpF family gas vesicle protein [Streptomyces roseus]|uniref:GvpL/GvpF family gas vesicle protein n=1 Tax=Streptomyces roseus TaxID=66430 RepID=UPI0033C66261
MTGTEPTLTYVYAVAARTPGLGEVLARLTGVAATPLTLLAAPGSAEGAPAFAVSQVPAAHWNAAALKAHFEDITWLEQTARAHHQVVEALAAHTTVLPLRLATLYEDRDRALTALREQYEQFTDRLALLTGHTEYGIKAYITADADSDPLATGTVPAVSPGKAYLRARKAQQHAHEEHHQAAARAAQQLTATAARYAAAYVRHPAQSGPLARDQGGENILNDAYLIPDEDADAFRAAVEQAAAALTGVRIEITGPWAPYSFATPPAQPVETSTGDRGTPT